VVQAPTWSTYEITMILLLLVKFLVYIVILVEKGLVLSLKCVVSGAFQASLIRASTWAEAHFQVKLLYYFRKEITAPS